MRTLTKLTALAFAGFVLGTASASADDNCKFHWVIGQGFTLICDGNSVTIPGPGAGGGFPPPPPPPGVKKVCVYKGPHYTGQHVCVNAGMSDSHINLAWNNQVTSLKVFGGAKIKLCQNFNYGGFCNTFWGNVPQLGGPLNNNASSYQTW